MYQKLQNGLVLCNLSDHNSYDFIMIDGNFMIQSFLFVPRNNIWSSIRWVILSCARNSRRTWDRSGSFYWNRWHLHVFVFLHGSWNKQYLFGRVRHFFPGELSDCSVELLTGSVSVRRGFVNGLHLDVCQHVSGSIMLLVLSESNEVKTLGRPSTCSNIDVYRGCPRSCI